MPSVNKVILVGHLGNDPELRQTASGRSLCKFRMATSRRWRDQQGQTQEDTCWHSVVTWGKSAEVCASYLRKGRQVYVEGRLSTRSYDDTQGVRRVWTEVVSSQVLFLGPKQGGEGAMRFSSTESAAPSEPRDRPQWAPPNQVSVRADSPPTEPPEPPPDLPDDELPF